jgi:hypothetical protein
MTRVALVLAVILFSPLAAARDCPNIAGGSPALQSMPVEERLEFVRHSLLEDESHAKVWWLSWVAFLSAAVAFQVSVASVATVVQPPPPGATHNFSRFVVSVLEDDAPGLWAGSVETVFGLASLTMTQAHAPFAGTAFDLHLKAEPLLDPCIALAEGERLLIRNATDEKNGRIPLSHILNVVVNLAASLVIGIGFRRYLAATIGFPLGVAFGEALILTQPTSGEDALARYRAGNLSPPAEPVAWGLSGGLRF